MILTALLTLSVALQSGQIPTTFLPPKPAAEAVLAKVNGKPIHASDVERLLWDWRGGEVTQDLISYELIHQEASKLKVAVSLGEVQKEYDRFAADQKKNLAPGQTFEDMLKERHQPKSRLFMQIESNILLTKIVDVKFDPSKFLKVSTLVFKPKSDAASDLQIAAGKAQDAYKRLVTGEDWDKVMNTTEQDPVLVQNKGLLGWRSQEAFPAITQAEIKTAKAGTILKPVSTQNGLQLFVVRAIGTSATGTDLQELKAIYEQTSKQNYLQNLQKSAKIERLYKGL